LEQGWSKVGARLDQGWTKVGPMSNGRTLLQACSNPFSDYLLLLTVLFHGYPPEILINIFIPSMGKLYGKYKEEIIPGDTRVFTVGAILLSAEISFITINTPDLTPCNSHDFVFYQVV
jgi:hypothetical protein